MRWIAVPVLALATLGCSPGGEGAPASDPPVSPGFSGIPNVDDSSLGCCRSKLHDGPVIRYFEYPLPDGRVVKCLWFDTFDEGNSDCDWAHAEKPIR